MSEANRSTAVLLIAHGSRRAEANEDLLRLAEQVRARSDFACVQPSYLELADPSIPAGGAMCIAAGARRVLMLPYFLSAGSHVVEDLERYRGQLAAAHPGVEFTLCPPLGLHPLIVDVVLARLAEGA
jgi:sirohydrochlorin ferrochelatase